MKKLFSLLVILSLFAVLPSCKPEIDPVTGKRKEYEPNVDKRTRKSVDEKGSVIFGGGKPKDTLANTNILWDASLQTLDFVPLAVASYNGGIISTEWYGNQKEKIKFEITFKSSEISPSSFEVKSFKQVCAQVNNCVTNKGSSELNSQIKNKIIEKARAISIEKIKNKKK